MKRYRIVFKICQAIGIILVLSITNIYASTRSVRFTSLDLVPIEKVAIVLGAQVRKDGSLSAVLYDRVTASVDLYKHGKIKKILMTGDNGRVNYDEVTAMKNTAVAQGIPAGDIILDYAGFSTYESCYRAKAIFGVSEAIIVTQNYHLPRAIYTCRALGIKSYGYGQPDWSRYANFMWRAQPRELLAQVKMLWQVHVAHPQPKFLGPQEIIEL